jgi:predicted XRE-type DNA-binding protein
MAIEIQLMEALAQHIEAMEWTEREAAWELETHQPTIHWILTRKRFGVSFTTLLDLWLRAGGSWKFTLSPPKSVRS